MADQTHRYERLAKVLARAQSDGEFRQRLVSQPQIVLWENGIGAPDGVEITVLENGPTLLHLVLPAKPVQHDPDERLEDLVDNGDVAGKQWAKLIDKARTDAAFKDRLLKDARTAVAEIGMQIPDRCEIRVVEELPKVAYLVLPAPQGDELSEQDLEKVAGGGFFDALGGIANQIGGGTGVSSAVVGTLLSNL